MLFLLIQSDNRERERESEREKTDWLSSNQIRETDEEKERKFLPSQILFIHQCLHLAFFFFIVVVVDVFLFHLMTIVDHASDCFHHRACVRAYILSQNVTSSVIVVLLFDALERP